MKKFAKVMAVALVAVMALAVLVACAPASDPDKAASALDKNGYVVSHLDSGKTADKLVLKGVASLIGVGENDLVARVSGLSSSGDTITIWYFASSKAAKKAWKDHEDYFNSDKDEDSDWTSGRSGKMIYAGTKQAVKDAR